MANLANHLRFTKLKSSKVVVTINNLLADPFSAKRLKRVSLPNIFPAKLSRYTVCMLYRINRKILIWQFGESHKDLQINCMPLLSHIYSKHEFLSNSTEIRQFQILPTALFEQIYSSIIPLTYTVYSTDLNTINLLGYMLMFTVYPVYIYTSAYDED